MKREFVVERDHKSFVLYAGLLDEAHRQGLKSIQTTLLQVPTPENRQVAICHATVQTERGTFSGVGDASPDNVPGLMRPHLIRMAETRAKARALRDAVNVGVAALEELGDVEGGAETGWHATDDDIARGAAVAASRPPQSVSKGDSPGRGPQQVRVASAATPAQIRAIRSIARERMHLSDAELDERALSLVGSRVAELTKPQASQLIDALRGTSRGS